MIHAPFTDFRVIYPIEKWVLLLAGNKSCHIPLCSVEAREITCDGTSVSLWPIILVAF